MPSNNRRHAEQRLSSPPRRAKASRGSANETVARKSGVRRSKTGDSQSPEIAVATAHAPCLAELDRIIAQQASKARNAAIRCKPTMWAYHDRMTERLGAWFAESADAVRAAVASGIVQRIRIADGGIAGSALALVQRADAECRKLHRDEASDLWAMSIYANRILRKWSSAPIKRRSLSWLRDRGGR